jgi:hypothetical protein
MGVCWRYADYGGGSKKNAYGIVFILFRRYEMSVVCSKGLIGKTVRLAALGSAAPVMIVTDVDDEGSKKVTVGWLDKNNGFNCAAFPSSSLDKADTAPAKTKTRKPVAGRKKR